MSSSPPQASEVVVIRPRHGWQPIRFRELWRFRELLLTLAARDIRVRYKQTVLGATWAVIQPLAQTLVFTAFFAPRGFSTDGAPAPVFYFCGLLPWQLFATSVASAGNSLVGNQSLITKVYFPRLVIPIAAITTSLVDFGISFGVFFLIMLGYGVMPSIQLLALPLFVALAFLCALAVGLWFSALNVEFRDVRYALPFITQFWFFVTPVIYPTSMVSAPWKRALLSLNPMSAVVEGFRWSLLGKPVPDLMLLVSTAMIFVLLGGGLFYFGRAERSFADVI